MDFILCVLLVLQTDSDRRRYTSRTSRNSSFLKMTQTMKKGCDKIRLMEKMKVYSLLALWLLMSGCGETEPEEPLPISPMEQLTGRYTLEWIEFTDGEFLVRVTRIVGERGFAGELALGADGKNASIAFNFDGEAHNRFGATWRATTRMLTIDNDPVPYTWDGTILEFSLDVSDSFEAIRFGWRKLP